MGSMVILIDGVFERLLIARIAPAKFRLCESPSEIATLLSETKKQKSILAEKGRRACEISTEFENRRSRLSAIAQISTFESAN